MATSIEIFEQVAARTLSHLRGTFPNPIELDAISIGHNVAIELDCDADTSHRVMTQDAINGINFLLEEGFIRFDDRKRHLSMPASRFPDAQLTMKGLAVLGATPEAIDDSIERRPIGQQLDEALQAGAKSAVSTAVNKAFAMAASFVMQQGQG